MLKPYIDCNVGKEGYFFLMIIYFKYSKHINIYS